MLVVALACSPDIALPPAPVGEDPMPGGVPQSCEGSPCELPASEHSVLGYFDVAVGEDGAAWMSWVELVDGFPASLWIARSPATGAAFEPAIEVPAPEPPIVGGTEKPRLDVRDGRIVVSFTGTGHLRHGDAYAAYAVTGSIDGGAIAWDEATLIEELPSGTEVLEQATSAIVDGGAVVLYKRQQYGVRDLAILAREVDGWEPVVLSEELSDRHECSPPDLLVADVGGEDRLYIVLRTNVERLLLTTFLREEAHGVFTAPVLLPSGTWVYSELICPSDGPRIARAASGELVVTWAGPSHDGSGTESVLVTSLDDGATWTGPVVDVDDAEDADQFPTVTALPDGRLLTTRQSADGTWLSAREAPGGAPVSEPLDAPVGGELELVEVATGTDRVVAVGKGEDGRLWLVELDPPAIP